VLTIDLGALARNWKKLAAISAPAECGAVVKANACGIGIEAAVPALWNAGCRTFFVAVPSEGVRVRAVAPEAAIYMLGGFIPEAAELYVGSNLRPVINHERELLDWEKVPGRRPFALHFDTGMNRLGFPPEDARALAASEQLRNMDLALVMSHLACAETPADPKNAKQLATFREIREHFAAAPASLANSAGIMLGPDYHFGLVRPGIALYGGGYGSGPTLDVVVTAEARILQVRDVRKGETVGYGRTETLKRDSRLAILAAGYADGYVRSGGSSDARPGAWAFVAGRRAPFVGRVSMDLIAVDVTDIPGVEPGQKAELFGHNVPVDEIAAAAGTIGYEFLTGLSRRAERVYTSDSASGGPLPAGEGVAEGDG
jgi:alanine racemase